MTGVLKVDDIQDAGANSIVSSNGSGTLTFGSFSAPNITNTFLGYSLVWEVWFVDHVLRQLNSLSL